MSWKNINVLISEILKITFTKNINVSPELSCHDGLKEKIWQSVVSSYTVFSILSPALFKSNQNEKYTWGDEVWWLCLFDTEKRKFWNFPVLLSVLLISE